MKKLTHERGARRPCSPPSPALSAEKSPSGSTRPASRRSTRSRRRTRTSRSTWSYDGNAGGSGRSRRKIALIDQAGEGWPDVVFSTQNNDAAWASKETNGEQAFAAPLNKGFLDQEFLDGFTARRARPASPIDGTVYGLRNDLAPVGVLVQPDAARPVRLRRSRPRGRSTRRSATSSPPSTRATSSARSATRSWHLRLLLGRPGADLPGSTATRSQSDIDDANSSAITAMLDDMLANGTLAQDSVFSAEFVAKYADKLVAMPGPAWYTGAIFQNPAASTPARSDRRRAAALLGGRRHGDRQRRRRRLVRLEPLEEPRGGQDVPRVRHQRRRSTRSSTVGLPGLRRRRPRSGSTSRPRAATSPATSRPRCRRPPGRSGTAGAIPSFSPETAWAKVVIPGLAAGKTIAELLAPSGSRRSKNEAQVNGYTVE